MTTSTPQDDSRRSRRRLLLSGAGLSLGAVLAAAQATTARSSAATGSTRAVGQVEDPRERMRQRHLPNVPLVTHDGQTVRFYDDLVKDRKVVINFMYTTCSNICTPMTRNLVEARALLGDAIRGVSFYSLSLTPLDDDPATLRRYMKTNGIEGSGWTFLTGQLKDVEQVRAGLGLGAPAGEPETDLSDHSGIVRIGDERSVRWGHASGLNGGRALARMIRFELAGT